MGSPSGERLGLSFGKKIFESSAAAGPGRVLRVGLIDRSFVIIYLVF